MKNWENYFFRGFLFFTFSLLSISAPVRAAAPAASPNGANIPALSTVSDGTRAWTLDSAGNVYINGTKDSYSANVALLLYFNGTIYQQNKSHDWWYYSPAITSGSPWLGHGTIPDPRTLSVAGASISTTTTYLVDQLEGVTHVWVIGPGGTVYKDGVKDQTSANVILLLDMNGTIYQQNTSKRWWSYSTTATTGNPWLGGGAIPDPRTVVSPNGTLAPTAPQIIDEQHHVWAVEPNGEVFKDGIQDRASSNVVNLLDYYGIPYQVNTSGNWYWWNQTNWTQTTDPRTAPVQLLSKYPGITCDGVTDSSVGVSNAFAAAAGGKFNLIVDCPVKIEIGSNPAKVVFVENNTTVIFYGTGQFIIDNLMQPAFAIANSTQINFINWNVEYNVMNGNNLLVTDGANGPSHHFNDVTLHQWLTANRGVTFETLKNTYGSFNANPFWQGANTMAVFFIVGETSNVTVTGMNIYAPPTATPNEFIPFVFSIGLGSKTGATIVPGTYNTSVTPSVLLTPATPLTSAYYALPNNLVFSGITLDGTLMGFVGGVQNSKFENITSNRYSDLQDQNGENVGGVGKWFPPPHLFYITENLEGPDPALFNNNVLITDVLDNGIRLGVARDLSTLNSSGEYVGIDGSGYTLSIKFGAVNSTLSNYTSYRPDGLMDVLASDGLTISNVKGTYNSSFINNIYPGIRFPATPYTNLTFDNVSLTDTATTTFCQPLGTAETWTNAGFTYTGVNVTLNQWGGAAGGLLSGINGTGHNLTMNYLLKDTNSVIQKVEKGIMYSTIEASSQSIKTGGTLALTWSSQQSASAEDAKTCIASETLNGSSVTSSGALTGSIGTSGTKSLTLSTSGTYVFSVTCSSSDQSATSEVTVNVAP